VSIRLLTVYALDGYDGEAAILLDGDTSQQVFYHMKDTSRISPGNSRFRFAS
jgi:hypothetical protein